MDLRDAIARAGGLYTRTGLARRWKVSKAYISEAVQHPDFPPPIPLDDGEREVWTAEDADRWRQTPRKPGPRRG